MKQTAGENLVKLLQLYDVEYIFGIPGTHSIELYRGLSSSHIKHISPRHEQGGGFMADGYARASGKPGVCFVITGPGVTNITTAMGEAYMDSVPMLVISPVNEPDPDYINRGRLHEITSQEAVTKPLTAMSVTVTRAEQIPEMIYRAFDIFNSHRPRPVHINIPLSIIAQSIDDHWPMRQAAQKAKANESELDASVKFIQAANSPILILGGGTTNGSAQMVELAEKIACPVITTVAARGVIPPNHPLTVGAQSRASYVQALITSADLALFLGTEFAQTDHWNDDIKLPENQIWVNLCGDLLANKVNELTIKADCIDYANRLAKRLSEPTQSHQEQSYNVCLNARQKQTQGLTDKEQQHWKILSAIADVTDNKTTIVSDMTQLAYTAIDYFPMQQAKQWFHPTGYGTLGYGLPAGIGVALADLSKRVLVIVGDGGIQYTPQEMTLAAELNLNLVVLLWNNNALQQICDDMDNAGISRVGVIQKNPDFIKLAEACHWQAWVVEERTELSNHLNKAFSCDGPVLVMHNENI